MRGTANRSAWIWVAIAAITLTALNGAESGLPGAKVNAHPVLERLIRLQNQSAAATGSAHAFIAGRGRRPQSRSSRYWSSRAWSSTLSLQGSLAGQPVEFVGLLTPLALVSIAFGRPVGPAPSAPLLWALSQRPPPAA